MTKKDLTVTIEEDILENAKKQIPNISRFFENCLKAYLGIDINSVFYTTDAQESLDIIKNAQTALYLMTERNDVKDNIKKAEQEEINMAWRRLFTEYRDTRTIDEDKLKHGVKVLGVDAEELSDIIEVCFVFSKDSDVDVTEWSEVYAAYGGGES